MEIVEGENKMRLLLVLLTCTCWANELFKYSAGKSFSPARPPDALAEVGLCNCA